MIKAMKHHSTPKIDTNTSKTQKLSINDLILASIKNHNCLSVKSNKPHNYSF